MRICIISTVHPSNDVRIYKKYICSLLEEGYEVGFVIKNDNHPIDKRINLHQLPNFKSRLSRIILGPIIVTFFSLRKRYDIYHFHDPELIPVAFLLHTFFRKRVVYDMHENFPKQILTKNWIYPIFRSALYKIIRRFEKILLKSTPTIFAESSYKTDYKYINRSVDILNLPRIDLLQKYERRKNKSILSICYMGRVTKDRGYFTMIKLMDHLRKNNIPVEFHCIGELDPDLCKHSDPQNFFYGRLDSEKGYQIVKNCDIGLALLQSVPNYLESYPTKLFEYIGLGVYPIISDFPLWKDLLKNLETGSACNPNNIEEIANEIVRILNCKQYLIHDNTFKVLNKNYNWEKEFKKVIQFYNAL